MGRDEGLGDLEQLVLMAVLQQPGQAYAVSVRDEIEGRTGREVSRGAVYVTLSRLEKKGLLRSELGDPTPERGGKAKRLFEVAPSGLERLQASLVAIGRMAEGLGLLARLEPTAGR